MASPPTRKEVLSLFRSYLRTARTFTDYNIREYAKRRASDAFRRRPADAAAAFAHGKSQLEVAKRQAILYSLYSPTQKNILEIGRC